MDAIKSILEDDREIESIHWEDAPCSQLKVGEFGCEKIVVYPEKGEYSLIPFIAVYKNGSIQQRFSALSVTIVYKLL